jgi:hypothetical protein
VLICIYFNQDKIYIHEYNDILKKYRELKLFYHPIKLNYIEANQKKTGKTTAVIFNSGLKNFQNKGISFKILEKVMFSIKDSFRICGF